MPSPIEELLQRLNAAASLGHIPLHIRLGGVAFGWIGWAIELKEMVLAVVEPVVKCKSVAEAAWTYLNLSNSQYVGIVTWIAIFVVTTLGLVALTRAAFAKKPHGQA